jgi:hypothetical protein
MYVSVCMIYIQDPFKQLFTDEFGQIESSSFSFSILYDTYNESEPVKYKIHYRTQLFQSFRIQCNKWRQLEFLVCTYLMSILLTCKNKCFLFIDTTRHFLLDTQYSQWLVTEIRHATYTSSGNDTDIVLCKNFV